MQAQQEHQHYRPEHDWTRYSFWCTPKGLGGEKIRLGFRKGVPLALASIVGLSCNQLTILVLSNQSILLSLSIADILATVTGVSAFGVIDYFLERCWPTDPRTWAAGFEGVAQQEISLNTYGESPTPV